MEFYYNEDRLNEMLDLDEITDCITDWITSPLCLYG